MELELNFLQMYFVHKVKNHIYLNKAMHVCMYNVTSYITAVLFSWRFESSDNSCGFGVVNRNVIM